MAERKIIPADLYEEILHLLPSNALLNFKRVCKDWNKLISSQRFIQKHLHRSNGTQIFEISGLRIILCYDPTGKKIYRNISYPPKFCDNDLRIAGSCDGLVCLVMMDSRRFAIINPSTGKSDVRTLTDGFFFHRRLVYWFGKHPSTGEYLIVALKVISSGITQVYILSSKQRSSEYFEIPPTAYCNPPTAFCPHLKPILLHGALHWPVIQQNVRLLVFAYDIEKKKLVEILHPFGPPFRVVRLGTMDGYLTAITWTPREEFEMWMMREYGVKESWSKYCSMEGFDDRHWVLSPLGFVGDGVLLLNVGNKKIVKYRFSDKKGRVVHRVSSHEIREREIAVLCGDSLVSPSIDWGRT